MWLIGVGSFDATLAPLEGAISLIIWWKWLAPSTCDIDRCPQRLNRQTKAIHGNMWAGRWFDSSKPLIGPEAGQSAFLAILYACFLGDILDVPAKQNYFRDSKYWTKTTKGAFMEEMDWGFLSELSHAASKITIEESGIIALELDWTAEDRPNPTKSQKELCQGLTLGRTAPNKIFRALVRSHSFWLQKNNWPIQEEGVRIDGCYCHWWGCPKIGIRWCKFLADVLNFPIQDH